MVLLAHLEKYVEAHPDQFPDPSTTLKAVRERVKQSGEPCMPAVVAEEVLGKDAAAELFSHMGRDAEYLHLSAEYVTAESK